VPSRLVTGVFSVPSAGVRGEHIWNVVEIGGKYYILDTTNNYDTLLDESSTELKYSRSKGSFGGKSIKGNVTNKTKNNFFKPLWKMSSIP
jgi:hypothetical protein